MDLAGRIFPAIQQALTAAAALLEPLAATVAMEQMHPLAIGLVAQAAAQAVVLALRQDLEVKVDFLLAVAVAALLHLERSTQAQAATVATGSCAW